MIISQLLSNMRKQVNRLSNLGFTATYIGKKNCNIDDVTRGYYQFVFDTPEILVGTDEWRGIFRHPEFSPRHKLTIIDESHAVYQWYCKNYTYILCYLKSLTYRYLFLCSNLQEENRKLQEENRAYKNCKTDYRIKKRIN